VAVIQARLANEQEFDMPQWLDQLEKPPFNEEEEEEEEGEEE
jgi:hypothetical protein